MKKRVAIITALVALVVICTVALCACGPNADPDKAVASLKANNYSAYKDGSLIPAAMKLFGINGVDCVVSGFYSDNDKSETIYIVYFYTNEQASESYEEVKSYFEEEKDADSGWDLGQNGKVVWYGTSAAVKAAK